MGWFSSFSFVDAKFWSIRFLNKFQSGTCWKMLWDRLTEDERKRLENLWSNPDPYPYLEKAMYVLYGEVEEQGEEHTSQVLDWTELAAILSIGRVYD